MEAMGAMAHRTTTMQDDQVGSRDGDQVVMVAWAEETTTPDHPRDRAPTDSGDPAAMEA